MLEEHGLVYRIVRGYSIKLEKPGKSHVRAPCKEEGNGPVEYPGVTKRSYETQYWTGYSKVERRIEAKLGHRGFKIMKFLETFFFVN